MVQRLDRTDPRQKPSDEALLERAQFLASKYLQTALDPFSIRWVTNQQSRWGSCTPTDRSIRISHRLQPMPQFVVDYVVLHELAHLLVPDHSADFKGLMDRYPQAVRAQGYLEGWAAAKG
jgi:predicted metal-dependent hydrolase